MFYAIIAVTLIWGGGALAMHYMDVLSLNQSISLAVAPLIVLYVVLVVAGFLVQTSRLFSNCRAALRGEDYHLDSGFNGPSGWLGVLASFGHFVVSLMLHAFLFGIGFVIMGSHAIEDLINMASARRARAAFEGETK